MSFKFYLFLLLITPFFLFSQEPSNTIDSLNNLSSKKEKIKLGRESLYKYYLKKDTTQVHLIFNFLINHVEDSQYMAINPDEYSYYNIYFKQYDKVIELVLKYDTLYMKQLQKKKFPPYDNMSKNLFVESRKTRAQTYNQINESINLSVEDKDFLILYFDYVLSWADGKDSLIETLNSRANTFIKKYPDSKYYKYVNDFIGFSIKTSKWNISVEYFIGLGTTTEKLGKSFTKILPLGFSFDFKYKDFGIKLTNAFGFLRTKDSIVTNDVVWKKGSPARWYSPGLAFSWNLYNNELCKLSPFIGISSTSISPPLFQSDKKGYEKAGFDFTTTFTFGVCFDLCIGQEPIDEFNWINPGLHFLRLTYSYNQPNFQTRYIGYNGVIHNFTIGYVIFDNPKWRNK